MGVGTTLPAPPAGIPPSLHGGPPGAKPINQPRRVMLDVAQVHELMLECDAKPS